MDSEDTNPLNKCCSKCELMKSVEHFISKRNICKQCRNEECRKKYNQSHLNEDDYEKKCNVCEEMKIISLFIKNRNVCKTCNNNKRVEKYKSDTTHREKIILQSSVFKKNKTILCLYVYG